MEVLRVNNFKGTNTEDENLSPNVLPFAYNIDTSKGRLSKRLGYASLVDIGSTGYPKGLHTAQLSSGDTLFVGADTSAYKLSGTSFTEVVTTTVDFNEGTIEDGNVNDSIISPYVNFHTTQWAYHYDDNVDLDVTETFTYPISNYSMDFERVLESVSSSGYEWTSVNVYVRDSSDNSLVRIYNQMEDDDATTWVEKIYVNGNIVVDAVRGTSTQNFTNIYYIDYVDGNLIIKRDTTTLYNNEIELEDAKSIRGVVTKQNSDSKIYEVNVQGYSEASYVSKIFDLSQTPVANTLDWTSTVDANMSLTFQARGSDDGVTFNDWSTIPSSGSSIPNKRYVQIQFYFIKTGTLTSISSVDDFTITYTPSFNTATQFDTGLTGNKIRWVNYQGQQDDGTGTATELKQYVYYCDGTSYKKYDGTTVTDITSSVVAPNIIYEHKGYMFFVPSGDETRLYYSDPYGADATDPLNAFEVTDATYYIQFPSKIKGLRTFQGKLVVSGDGFTSFVTGDIFGGTDDNTVVYEIDDKGVPNHESMAICSTNQGNILALVTRDGLVYLSGSEYENALEQKPLTTTVQSYINEGSFTNSYLKYHDGKLYFGFNSGVVPTDYVDSILVFNFRNQLTIDGVWDIGLNDMAVFNNRLYGSSSDTTNILELLSGQSDNGSDINMKAVIRFNFGNVETTIQRVKIKATTDSNFTDLTNANLIVYNDSHKRDIDLTGGRWRESQTHYPQYKGQDLMESKRSIKKRGTFVEATFAVESSYKFEIDSLEFEYKGVRQ
jgi:hypothetical protein